MGVKKKRDRSAKSLVDKDANGVQSCVGCHEAPRLEMQRGFQVVLMRLLVDGCVRLNASVST